MAINGYYYMCGWLLICVGGYYYVWVAIIMCGCQLLRVDDYYFLYILISDHEDLFLVIHNIDGTMLRPEKVQSVFSYLSQIRGIHIMASIDHINAPLSEYA